MLQILTEDTSLSGTATMEPTKAGLLTKSVKDQLSNHWKMESSSKLELEWQEEELSSGLSTSDQTNLF